MIFIKNKYTNYYYNIIDKAKARALPPEIYTEKHHIIPKSLGGDNSKDNLAKLTAREHFICHRLLIKMVENNDYKKKMRFALNSFRRTSSNQQRYILSARQYEIVRNEASAARSQSQMGNKFAAGFKQSAETIAKRTAKVLGQKRKPWNDEQRKNLSKSMTNKSKSEEAKKNMSIARKGVPTERKGIKTGPLSEETKKNMRKPKKKLTCPQCGLEGGSNNITRYHFDNCANLKYRQT